MRWVAVSFDQAPVMTGATRIRWGTGPTTWLPNWPRRTPSRPGSVRALLGRVLLGGHRPQDVDAGGPLAGPPGGHEAGQAGQHGDDQQLGHRDGQLAQA